MPVRIGRGDHRYTFNNLKAQRERLGLTLPDSPSFVSVNLMRLIGSWPNKLTDFLWRVREILVCIRSALRHGIRAIAVVANDSIVIGRDHLRRAISESLGSLVRDNDVLSFARELEFSLDQIFHVIVMFH
ncbi:hypothetical protein LMG31841_02371 [Paraburkholderia saeva]|uniref:Uncharacterized protein n=1 Tax=Paraburkholderia saeva TaxID=2777537 RepID=A0A9N8RWR7_9BURK|nr:hypothetical protein LMG31841_02371 [Paraburkholderia saeva]